MITFTNGRIMLSFFYVKFIKRFKMEIFRLRIKYNYNNKKVLNYTTQSVNLIRYNSLKKKNIFFVSTRSFCSGNVKLNANTLGSIKDLTSNLQAESSADAARRITRNPNPNRIVCLVKRIYTIFIESDLDTKINNMDNLLSENFWTENQEMGDKAKIALEKMLRHEVLEGEEAFHVDNFFIKEGISLEGLRLEDLRAKIENCQNFYTQKYSDLQEKLKEWKEEKNNLLLEEEEENSKDKGKQPDYSLHPSYNVSEDINSSKTNQKEGFYFIKTSNLNSSEILYTQTGCSDHKEFYDNYEFNYLANKKRKFSDFNDTDQYDEGKIIKKAKITDNSSIIDDYADISCEPLDIIDLDG
jgi:hypothetical protein